MPSTPESPQAGRGSAPGGHAHLHQGAPPSLHSNATDFQGRSSSGSSVNLPAVPHQPPLGPPQKSDCPVPSRVQSEATLQGLRVHRATTEGISNNPNGSQGWPGAGDTAGARTRTRGIRGIWSPATFWRWDRVSSFLHTEGQRRTGVSATKQGGREAESWTQVRLTPKPLSLT